ncbi:MAG TPA: MerR family DNA-binding transcriptional regulator [Caulobacteraceae bacterium]
MPTELRRPERTFSIRQLCLEFKCTARALRFYEDKGLLAPARQGLSRIYSYKDRARLQLILRGKAVGLSLIEIREILDLYGKEGGRDVQNAKALRKFRERIVALERQREEVTHALAILHDSCERLEAQLARSRPDLLPPDLLPKAGDSGMNPRIQADGQREMVSAK